ncbi:hypothetical protein [Vibrio vulnificus YJ016]|uniref:Uncharacterized protein n=1 Tax=Vibrio vulnificus (strain YJ016) TaxID=196600 RepID=Q7MLK2_VIBVY|nr:hypothetical protein [Vibrio vulnificus YJ016]
MADAAKGISLMKRVESESIAVIAFAPNIAVNVALRMTLQRASATNAMPL